MMMLLMVVIVISLAPIVPLRFCCENENNILPGVDELSVESSNANTCESTLAINVFAVSPFTPGLPSAPSSPCLVVPIDITLESDTLAEAAVIVTEPLCGVVVFVIVNVFDEEVAVICDGELSVNV